MIYLASQSPRRRELLEQIGVPYRLLSVEVDESVIEGEKPEDYVARLASAKARAGARQLGADEPAAVVLGSDTSVVLDSRILGKPRDEAEGRTMLSALSGRSHQVLSGVCLFSGERELRRVSCTKVSFRPLSAELIDRYWQTGEGRDKAGAYGIQGMGAALVTGISGSYSGVVGLPIEVLVPLLEEFGLAYWEGAQAACE